jgi:shikimate kinase
MLPRSHSAMSLPASPSGADVLASCRTVFLVGFMGAGKTTVGRALSVRLGWPFEDLDDRIHAREQRTIEQIFRQSGEAAFRDAEHAALAELLSELSSQPRIVALGGGAFVQARNATLLKQAGAFSVFLDAPVEELFRRSGEQEAGEQKVERPLRRSREQFLTLFEARRAHYLQASCRIETHAKDVQAVVAEIMARLGLGPLAKAF